jgi:hypothetical protein
VALAKINGWWDAEERAAMVCAAVTNAMRCVQATIGRFELEEDGFVTWEDFVRRFVFDDAESRDSGRDEDQPITKQQAVGFMNRLAGFK